MVGSVMWNIKHIKQNKHCYLRGECVVMENLQQKLYIAGHASSLPDMSNM